MKGKLKFLYSTILCLTACLIASVCLLATFSRREQVAQAVGVKTDDYSLFDKNTGVIMSVEKVAVQSGDNQPEAGKTPTELFNTKLYKTSDCSSEVEKMYSYNYANGGAIPDAGTIADASAVYYNNIRNGSNEKYVVGDGEFVMLNNHRENGAIINDSLGTVYTDAAAENGGPVRLQEAILISLGQYFGQIDAQGNFDETGKAGQNAQGSAAAYQSGANIELIRVQATHNGQNLALPGPRTYQNQSGQQREDFVWIIPQTDGCEGYYDLNFNFRYNGNFYPMHFSFYILLGESYYGNLTDRQDNEYSAQPTLTPTAGADGLSHFYLGEGDSNRTYPTLTYDVTKYDISYTHTANGVETRYDFASGANAGMMNLTCTKTGPNGSSSVQTYPLGPVGKNGNIAVVVFTEMGRYNISYKYKYQGYNAERSPAMNLALSDSQLVIHGAELKYAKSGYNEAQMRHLTFANNANSNTELMGVGLVVPNGYRNEEITPGDVNLGVLYDYDTESQNRVGSLLELESANVESRIGEAEVDPKLYLNESETDLNITFAKTNQSVLWFDSYDQIMTESYYYFAPNTKRLAELIIARESENYTNTKSFNQPGYYLAFIKIQKSGGETYTSVFAFQYSSETVAIHTEKVDADDNTTPIASGEYTNEKVRVWWENPGVFEREIAVKFVRSADNSYPTWEQLATQIDSAGVEIESGTTLGDDTGLGAVSANTGATFLIKMQSVGKNAVYRTFIVDKQPISGVQAYAVESGRNRLENLVYTVIKNQNGANLALDNSITNSYATLDWQDKASGAKIGVTYSFTPFVVDNGATASEVGGTSADKVWFTTSYKLGKTIGGLDLQKPNLDGELNSASMLFEQGIYLFTLTDEAGNSCKYMFVVDNTENYFKITDADGETLFSTRENLLYTNQVDVEIGTHKVFALNAADEKSDEMFEIISAAAAGNLAGNGYYSQPGTNSGKLQNLFARFNDSLYLTVENSELYVYDNQREPVTDKTEPRKYTIKAAGSSNVRQFYAVGANQIVLDSPLNSNSYEIIEVNTDHSFGAAYYGSSSEMLTNFENLTDKGANGANRLYYDDDGNKTEMAAARATGANYLAFSWRTGTGEYKVKSVTMQFYQLDLTRDSFDLSQNYFYKPSGDAVAFYSDGVWREDVSTTSDENQRAVVVLNVARYQTTEGLYVITREYEQDLQDGNDKKILNYYFIVDRRGIIVSSDDSLPSINGGYISLGLRDNESQYRDFNTVGVPSDRIDLGNDVAQRLNYNIYYTTTRLPAVLNIPVGKYFYSDYDYRQSTMQNGANYYGSEYYAGRLNVELRFKDSELQVQDLTNKNNLLLYSSNGQVDAQAGYYKLDTTSSLDDTLKNRFLGGGGVENSEYLTLPGDYILIISDNVEGATHQKVIGIRVLKNDGPTTDIYSARSKQASFAERVDSAAADFTLTTAKEFVIVDMKNPEQQIGTQIWAELDLDYLYITQNYDGRITEYVKYNHGNLGGQINIDDQNDDRAERIPTELSAKTQERKIYLETFLRDNNNQIQDYETLKKPLSYTVTIRYKISTAGGTDEKYAGCYYYYDTSGQQQLCYETSYTVTIDREPPQANTRNLEQLDGMSEYYTDGEMFENAIIEQGEDVFFVRRMKDYYTASSKDKANLYAFHVNAATPYYMTEDGIARVYTRRITSLDTLGLTLPTDFTLGYSSPITEEITTFGNLGLSAGNYYEILEQDAAGNTTQYLVYYTGGNENFVMQFSAKMAKEAGEIEESPIEFDFNADGQSYTIFSLSSPMGTLVGEDRFYRFELYKNGSMVGEFTTNLATNFRSHEMSVYLENLLSEFGNYTIRLISSRGESRYTINYLDQANQVRLVLEKLVKIYDDGRYYIDLAGANDSTSMPGVTFYATEITIKGEDAGEDVELTYTCRVDDGEFNYYDRFGVRVENNVVSAINGKSLSGSYMLTVTDVFGRTDYYSFNTNGEKAIDITFGEDGNAAYSEFAGTYYGFTQANISYDNVLYSGRHLISYTLLVKGNQITGNSNDPNFAENGLISVDVQDGRTIIVVKPYFEDGNKTGGTLSVIIRLSDALGRSYEYNVIVDTTTGAVSLKDNEDAGANKEYVVGLNKFTEDELLSVEPTTTYSGIFYLSWVPTQNDWFDYDYTIYEQLQNGLLRVINLNDTTNFVISTQEESTGKYRFVITIKNKQGVALGNKVYAFAVQSPVDEIYSVRTADGQAVLANSTFKFSELYNKFTYNGDLNGEVPIDDPMGNTNDLPLYVYNQELVVDIAKNIGAAIAEWKVFDRPQDAPQYSFTIYRVYSLQNTYNFYFGTLIVSRQDNLIKNLKMTQNGGRQDERITEITSPELSQTNNKFYGASDNTFVLSGEQNSGSFDDIVMGIIYKNTVVLSIWCNGEYVSDVNVGAETQNGTFKYNILGSGQFSFVFKDLAGNTHNFNHDEIIFGGDTVVDELNLIVMREVVLLSNGMNAVNNAFYNGQVEVEVFNPGLYSDVRSIVVNCKRNGEDYKPEVGSYRYLFKDLGKYRITATAQVGEITLSKTLVFTIVDENEARQSFDLTNVFGYKITRVLNNRAQDITSQFVNLMNARQGQAKYLLTYDFLLQNAEAFGITSGKQKFVITYLVEDGIYSAREIEFGFTLNNQQPTIQSSVEPGGSTKKSFTITYTPAIIYDQVGDCELYINDILVCTIDENSANITTPQSYTISYDANGKGDYYVILRGASGAVHTSFVVTVKEPLNTWSIIIIVVVVAIILAIVGTIIFLRKRMKIR